MNLKWIPAPRRLLGLACLLICCCLVSAVQAGTRKNKLGLLYGQWQPNLLKSEKSASVFAGTANSTPYMAMNFDHVLYGTVAFHLSLGYWAHLYEESAQKNTLVIIPLEMGIEHQLIDNSPISPYVLYGGGMLFGTTLAGDRLNKFRISRLGERGFELFLLTGLRIIPFRFINFDLSFGYLYAKFPRTLGVGDDFSGVRALVGIHYIF